MKFNPNALMIIKKEDDKYVVDIDSQHFLSQLKGNVFEIKVNRIEPIR